MGADGKVLKISGLHVKKTHITIIKSELTPNNINKNTYL